MQKIYNSTGYENSNISMVHGDGCILHDNKGKTYTDFESGVWCLMLGYNQKRINDIIIEQTKKCIHLGYRFNNLVTEEAADKVLEVLQIENGKCVFLSSGSEAVEFSIQITKEIKKKSIFLTLSGSYLSAFRSSGEKRSNEWYVFEWEMCNDCKQIETCDQLCEHLQKIPFLEICGFVFEPGNMSGTVKLPPKSMVQLIAKLVNEYSGLIIVDEVTTGIGRTGEWFGFNHYDIKPHIVALGKGLGNGYPVSAVAFTDTVAEQLDMTSFHYIQSHQNDPLGCAIAKETLSIIDEMGLIERARNTGSYFLEKLNILKSKHSIIKQVRGLGLMICLEIVSDNGKIDVSTIFEILLDEGFIVGCKPAANIIRFYPPLIISENEITRLIEVLDKILSN